MCGVVGVLSSIASPEWKKEILGKLLMAARIRGTDATGIAYVDSVVDTMVVQKDGVSAEKFMATELYDSLVKDLPPVVMGHCRAATKGINCGPENNINNHPFYAEEGRIALMHNGLISDDERWRESVGINGAIKNAPVSKVDSEVMLRAIETYFLGKNKGDMFKAIDNATFSIAGSYVLGVLAADFPNKIWLVRHKNPLSLAYIPQHQAIIFASEADMIKKALTEYEIYLNWFYEENRPFYVENSLLEDHMMEIEVLTKDPWFNIRCKAIKPPDNSSRSEKEIVPESAVEVTA